MKDERERERDVGGSEETEGLRRVKRESAGRPRMINNTEGTMESSRP